MSIDGKLSRRAGADLVSRSNNQNCYVFDVASDR